MPLDAPTPVNAEWRICYKTDPDKKLTYPLDTSLVQCKMDWITYPSEDWRIFSTDNTIARANPYRAVLIQSFPDFTSNMTTPTQFAEFNLDVTSYTINKPPLLPELIKNQKI